MKPDLQLFSGTLTCTVVKGPHVTTASASPSSSIAKDDTVTLTLIPAEGYHLVVSCTSGNVNALTIGENNTYTFSAPEASTIFNVTAEADNLYRVLEETSVNVNGNKLILHANVVIRYGANGAIAEAGTDGTAITGAAAASQIEALLNAGLIEHIVTAGNVAFVEAEES